MSIAQAHAFRTFVNENESVQEQIQAASTALTLRLTDLAAEHGYTFTAEEAQSAWDAAQDGDCAEYRVCRTASGVWILSIGGWVDSEVLKSNASGAHVE